MFEVGDKVRIVGDHHEGRKGIIRRVYDDGELHPYRVEFPGDGYWPLFTADELERIEEGLMQYAIVNRHKEYTDNGQELITRSVFGPFASREEAEEYNDLFPFPEYNLIVPFHPATEED